MSGGLIDAIGGQAGTQTWTYPERGAVPAVSHQRRAASCLGLETQQLNSTFHYDTTNRDANQLTTLQAIGLFANALGTQAVYPDPFDAGQPVADRARAYLHTNCSQCHRPNGGTTVNMDLRFATAIADTQTCNITPTAGNLSVAGARRIAARRCDQVRAVPADESSGCQPDAADREPPGRCAGCRAAADVDQRDVEHLPVDLRASGAALASPVHGRHLSSPGNAVPPRLPMSPKSAAIAWAPDFPVRHPGAPLAGPGRRLLANPCILAALWRNPCRVRS